VQAEQYALMRQQEEGHWWYRGNRAAARRLLRHFCRELPARRLDAGCGTGKNLEALSGFGEPFGVDFDQQAIAFSRGRGFRHLARGSITALPLADASMDLVTCFEVLYHRGVGDWQQALAEFHRVLRPGGTALLREPAFPALRGSHDVVVHGSHRFRRHEFRAGVERAGFTVLRCSYQNMVTFLPALLIRSWQRWRRTPVGEETADFGKGAGIAGALCSRWLGFEGALLQFTRLPFGSSVVCVARKRA